MDWKYLVLGLAALALIGGYLYFNRETPPDPQVAHCYLPLGGKSGISLKLNPEDKEVDLSFSKEVTQSVAPASLDAFTRCVEVSYGFRARLPKDFERIPLPTPLGSIIDNWINSSAASTSLLSVAIQPLDDRELNNILVGPSVGARSRIVADWCERHPVSKCITCSEKVSDQTTTLFIGRKLGAKFKKIDMGNAGPAATDGSRPRWELEEGGKRIAFECGQP
jgi:hypothetical protein